MSDTEPVHSSHRQLYGEIRVILDTWNSLYRQTTSSNGNKSLLQSIMALLEFIEKSLPVLQAWCGEYLTESSLTQKLRGWLTYGVRACVEEGEEAYVPAAFETHWKLFFRREDDEADIAMLHGKEFDISYRHYLRLLKERREECMFSRCDDPAILAIHENKPCSGGGIGCNRCDEQDDLWTELVRKRYQSKNNVFLNAACGTEFIDEWLSMVKEMSKEERARIEYCWPPVHTYYCHKKYERYRQPLTSSLEIYLQYALDTRQRVYYSYDVRPKVEFEWVYDLQRAMADYRLPPAVRGGGERKGVNQWNDVFVFVSQFISYAPYLLYLDKRRCQEVTAVYARLPDD